MIQGHTNVLSARFGSGCADGLGRELGRFVVTTMEIPWEKARGRIGGRPEAIFLVESMEIEVVERQLRSVPPCEAIVAVGGGQAIDLGKYFAWKLGARLVTVPTILSVDAFVTPAAGIRRDHKVVYIGSASPDPLVIDYDLIRTAPAELNVAGVGDLLSIHTGTHDWELAHRAGRSEYPFSKEDVAKARGILQRVLDAAPDIRKCTDEGLRRIVEGYMEVNTICLPSGHYRVEEGSEHYLFYALEEALRRPFVHGHVVGLGVYLMSRLQENDPDGIRTFLGDVGLPYHPADMNLARRDLEETILGLAAWVKRRGDLWYTIIDERPIPREWVVEALAGLRFP